jgi:hypothetical protein
MTQSPANNNSTIKEVHENIMVVFQDKAQQITREHVEMLQMIYKKDHSNIERRKMFFEQHYIFLKEELTDLLSQVTKKPGNNEDHSFANVKDKLGEILNRYLNFFKDTCNPKKASDGV